MTLQVWGVLLAPQRLVLGMQSPPQLPLEHTLGQTAPLTQAPFSSQVWVVRLLGPLQRFVPGLHVPVHWPMPLHTFGQGMGSGTHSPSALQVSGVCSVPQCLLFGVHMPAHAPAVQTAAQVSFITQAPATVHCSTTAPAQRVAPALQAGPPVSPSGPSISPPVPATGASADPPCPPPLPPVVPADPPPLPPAPPPPDPPVGLFPPVPPVRSTLLGSYLFGSAQLTQPTASTTQDTHTHRRVASAFLGHPSKPEQISGTAGSRTPAVRSCSFSARRPVPRCNQALISPACPASTANDASVETGDTGVAIESTPRKSARHNSGVT